MSKRLGLIVLLIAVPILAGAAGFLEMEAPPLPPVDDSGVQGLTVHEWGTFTSVAGLDGTSMEWLPAGGPTDLPCFVNLAGAGAKGLSPNLQGGRANRARVRMETPVVYFYAPHEESVNVKVSFPQGLVTEWYPSATLGTAELGPVGQWKAMEAFPAVTSTIEWKNVKVMPGATENYPIDDTESHYYAARRTGSAPLQAGTQFEKFLFYRGIGSFMPPLSARVLQDGAIEVANLGKDTIPSIVLFENRGGKIGYRIHSDLSGGPVKVQLPELDDSFESLQQDLESMLRDQGMYALEARAMVDTWRDSWFEQGARVFYIVPSKTVDTLLPLEVHPKPVSVARAFVGRMEVFTPRTLEEVRLAVESLDRTTLKTYGRFLEPILHDFLKEHRADSLLASIRENYVADVTACTKKKVW